MPRWALALLRLINFATVNHKDLAVTAGQVVTNDEVMHLSLNAEVVVVGKRTFTNLADVENPAEDLVGIASSASQGAITARQLDVRPFMRQGEVLETVPGVIITQRSGEGKANQYFLRGFNLDHGSDFAMTVAGTPVNMPTHAHSQGYSDINFLIPELVAGVQYSKGPYFADQGDFATAGAETSATQRHSIGLSFASRQAPTTLAGCCWPHHRRLAAVTSLPHSRPQRTRGHGPSRIPTGNSMACLATISA